MKMIGLIGGVSWESTREYYRMLNEEARVALGGLHSAPILLHSFDFAEIAALQASGDWEALNVKMADAAKGLQHAGAELIAICSNYMHRCAPAVQEACSAPLVHIADVVGDAVREQGQSTVALLGAEGTMAQPFYRERLAAKGVEVLIPEEAQRAEINRVIFEELCKGEFNETSRQRYLEIMDELAQQGAQGVILGCTEIEQLIRPQDTQLVLYPSAEMHAKAIAKRALAKACTIVAA